MLDAIAAGGEAKLTADLTATANMSFLKEFKLDLNGHKINADWAQLLIKNKVTIADTSDAKTGEISPVWFVAILDGNTFTLEGGKIANDYSTIQFDDDGDGGTFIMNGGEVYYDACDNGSGVAMFENSTFTMNGGKITQGCASATKVISAVNVNQGGIFTMNDGTIDASKSSGVTVWGNAEAVINGGTITAKEAAITTNGTADPASPNYGGNAKITVNGGTLTSTDEIAIYAPAVDGTTIINGGTITGKTGIEIRAGSLTVNGGAITGTADAYSSTPNGNGSTNYGSAIAIAQHTTKQTINVVINDGTFSALSPISIENPQGNGQSDLDKITIDVKGGDFSAKTDEPIKNNIASIEKFVSGGTYSHEVPAGYVVDSFVTFQNDEGKYVVAKIYNITVADDSKDAVTVEANTAPVSKKVKVTAKDKDGFTKEIVVKDATGATITVSGDSFEMPDSDVTVSVKYTEIPKEPEEKPKEDEPTPAPKEDDNKTEDAENPSTGDNVIEFAIIFEICAIGLAVSSGYALYCKKHNL